MTFSYTHRFGAGSGDFQISKFLGINKGRVQGRVYHDLNGNGQDDAGEPGAGGMTVRLDEKRNVETDTNGHYRFSAIAGEYAVALTSNELGVRLRASGSTPQKVSLNSGETRNVNFGVSDFGFVGGHVFNDLDLTGATPKSNFRGIGGVKVVLRSKDNVVEQTTDGTGTYKFSNLRPGNYTLEIVSATLPANFQLPTQTLWEIKVHPLQAFYFDVPTAAQRAVAGIVFADTNGDGKFNPQTDELIKGAFVSCGKSVAISDKNGAYILRNLAAGKNTLQVRISESAEPRSLVVELDSEPVTKRDVNLNLFR